MTFKHQAQIIKVARLNKEWNQEQLADYLGLETAQFISNIERELAAIPSKHWKKIANLVGKQVLLNAILDDLRDQFKREMK